jgi:deferrochelatase/peroxidase EfeB
VALEVHPQRVGAESRNLGGKGEKGHDNDFRYWAGDRDGMICPKGAHIRRTNPRDAFGGNGRATRRHRIVRRGIPYGPRLKGRMDDGRERGLIFVCFNACFERQFEVIQAQWCNDGNAFQLGGDKDYFLGDGRGTGKFTIQGSPPHFARAQPLVVLTRGCEYLLMPGIRVLRRLAR